MTQKRQASSFAASHAETEPSARGHDNTALFGIPADRLLQDWKQAHERALAYLEALGLPADEGATLAIEAVERALGEAFDPGCDGTTRTMRVLRRLLTERYPAARRQWDKTLEPSTAWRLDAALSRRFTGGNLSAPQIPVWDGRFRSTPKIKRAPMVPERVERRFLRRLLSLRPSKRVRSLPASEPLFGRTLRRQRRRLAWTRVAARRRLLLAFLVLIPTIIASGFMLNVLPDRGHTWLEFAIVVFFGALFGWISIGFWTALFGFFTLLRRRDRFAITNLEDEEVAEVDPNVRAAIVMPICEEPIESVFAGLKAIHRSLDHCGGLRHFDFFILSDTSDPGTAVREEEAWLDWCRETGGFDHIFYRRRKIRLKRKSGNVADFCRRWGSQYRYMLMLDADSLMAGETVVRLLQLMERNTKVGMIQTAPVAVNRRSLFSRVEQFASRV